MCVCGGEGAEDARWERGSETGRGGAGGEQGRVSWGGVTIVIIIGTLDLDTG